MLALFTALLIAASVKAEQKACAPPAVDVLFPRVGDLMMHMSGVHINFRIVHDGQVYDPDGETCFTVSSVCKGQNRTNSVCAASA